MASVKHFLISSVSLRRGINFLDFSLSENGDGFFEEEEKERDGVNGEFLQPFASLRNQFPGFSIACVGRESE